MYVSSKSVCIFIQHLAEKRRFNMYPAKAANARCGVQQKQEVPLTTEKRTDFPVSHASSISHAKHRVSFKQFCQTMKTVATHQNRFFFLLVGPLNECYINKHLLLSYRKQNQQSCYLGGVVGTAHDWEFSEDRVAELSHWKPQKAKTHTSDQSHHCLLALGFLISWAHSTFKQQSLITS